MSTTPNSNVITSWNRHSDGKHYHTTVCRNVWQIQQKRYVTEAKAESWGLTECAFCRDDVDPTNGDRSIYEAALEAGRNATEGD